jgi:hypothetical protein
LYTSCVLGLRLFVLFNDMTLFIKKKKNVRFLVNVIAILMVPFFIISHYLEAH